MKKYRLQKDNKRRYIVFPSWLQPVYKWEDLTEIITNPLKYDDNARLNYSLEDFVEMGYPKDIQPFELIKGPIGGGIILVYADPDERWLPGGALTFDKGVDIRISEAMEDEICNVTYLEHCHHPGSLACAQKKMKNYLLHASAEHVESMSDRIFWVFGYKSYKRVNREIRGISDVTDYGKHFGLEVKRLSEVPKPILNETANWLDIKDLTYVWFDVKGGGTGFGLHFAILLYIGYRLCSVGGPRMGYAHLLASIEGEPRPFSSGKFRAR